MLANIRANAQKAKHALALALFAGTMAVANSQVVTMAGGWDSFNENLTSWFKDGLGGPGLQGLGTAIAVIGIVAAVISFIIHKFNPQSRMPGPIMCLAVALVGTIAMSGLDKPLQIVEAARDTIYGWMGI